MHFSVFHLLYKSNFSLFVLFIHLKLFVDPFIVKIAFCFFAAGAIYTSHLVEIASNYQLTRMAGKFRVRANKVVGTHAGAKIVGLKFLSAEKCLRTAFVAL